MPSVKGFGATLKQTSTEGGSIALPFVCRSESSLTATGGVFLPYVSMMVVEDQLGMFVSKVHFRTPASFAAAVPMILSLTVLRDNSGFLI